MARVLLLLPARDFDPSEAAASWRAYWLILAKTFAGLLK